MEDGMLGMKNSDLAVERPVLQTQPRTGCCLSKWHQGLSMGSSTRGQGFPSWLLYWE